MALRETSHLPQIFSHDGRRLLDLENRETNSRADSQLNWLSDDNRLDDCWRNSRTT